MRWDRLFEDLEAAGEAERRAAFEADVAERTRAEHAALTVADRLRAHRGREVGLRLTGGESVSGRIEHVGATWVALDAAGPVLVPLAAVAAVSGLARTGAADADRLDRRVPLTVVLRRIARDRSAVRLQLRGGAVIEGTLDRVGADHVDVAEHPTGEPRRLTAVRGVVTVGLDAVLALRIR